MTILSEKLVNFVTKPVSHLVATAEILQTPKNTTLETKYEYPKKAKSCSSTCRI